MSKRSVASLLIITRDRVQYRAQAQAPSKTAPMIPVRPRFDRSAVKFFIALFFFQCSAVSLGSDEIEASPIHLNDGSVIVGTIRGYEDDHLIIDTAFASGLKVAATLIAEANQPIPAELLLDDQRLVTVPELIVSSGQLSLGSEVVPIDTIAMMDPEDWQKGEGYQWQGSAGAALAFNRGNTISDQLDITADSQFESTRDRITVRGKIERDDTVKLVQTLDEQGQTQIEKQSSLTADRWEIIGKYDYFLSDPKDYLGLNASVEADALADIRLRTYLGPYFGRQLFDNPWGTLDGEIGAVYVDTDFRIADDTTYPGLNWNLTGESEALGFDSRLYLTHVGILNLQQSDQPILNTTIGLSFPFVLGLEAAAEMVVNYDGGAAAGTDKVDQAYKLRFGYSW